MKLYKLAYGMVAAALMGFTSCNNDYPTFNDADAFVAFTSATAFVSEADGKIDIPVMLTSLSGLTATVNIEVDTEKSTAKEGTDFTIVNKTLSFDAENTTRMVTINVTDDEVFTGNKVVILKLGETSVNFGASKVCTLTIEDNEHPLLFILGEYTTSVESYFSGRGPWPDHVISISRDNDDINKVWIGNIDPYFAQYGYKAPNYNLFYGTVNEDKTEISIPCGQEVGYENVCLYGFDDPDASNDPDAGGKIIISIQNDGKTLVMNNAWGVCRSDDLSGGWFNLILGPTTFTKK